MPRPLPSNDASRGVPELRRLRVVATVLLVTFTVAVAVITFWPGPPDPDGQWALKQFLAEAHRQGSLKWLTFSRVEFSANVLMFVPIGLFGALALSRHHWLIVPIAIVASSAIELIQAARFAERFGTPRDVIANGLGALIGYLLAVIVVRVARRRARSRLAATAGSEPARAVPAEG